MKITAVIRAQAVYALKPNVFGSVQTIELADALQQRYTFRQIPTIQELTNPPAGQPASFVWGKKTLKGREITVARLEAMNYPALATTIMVSTATSTDDCDLVLEDLIKWVSETFHLDTKPVFPTNYLTQLEVQLEKRIKDHLRFLESAGRSITQSLKKYGFAACPDYEPTAFSMYYDTGKLTNPPTFATAFSLERRVGVPFEEDKYFSQAPLKNQDHIAMLNELETLP